MKHTVPNSQALCCGAIQRWITCSLFLILFAIPGWSNNLFTPGITTQPQSKTACQGSTVYFSVVATGTGLTYTWQVSTNGGSTWTTLSNNSQYNNVNTAILTVFGVTAGMNNFQYRCNVSDGATVSSSAAVLTVNGLTAPVVQTANTSQSLCISGGGSIQATASTSSSIQWQVSTDGGLTWTNTVDGTSYSGSTSTGTNVFLTLLAFGPDLAYGNLYHYIATDGNGCSATGAMDTIFAYQPVVSAPVTSTLVLCPPTTTVINGSVSSAHAPITDTHWELNGTPISDNATYSGTLTSSLTINVTTALNGRPYRLAATDSKGCTTYSGTVTLTVPALTAASVPANKYACANADAGTLSATVTSVGGAPTRQWQTDNGTTAAGGPVVWSTIATNTGGLALGTVTLAQDGWHYRAIVTSVGGCATLTTNESVLHTGSSGYWLGVTDTNWHVPTNWCGGVPTSISNTDVVIPTWAPRMPTISPTTAAAFWQSLTMQNNTTLRITGGTYPYNLAPSVYTLNSVAYLADADQYILPATHDSLKVGGSLNKLLQVNTAVNKRLTLGGSAKLVTGNNTLTMKAGSNPIAGAVFAATSDSWIVTGNGLAGAANTGLGGLAIEQIGASSGVVVFPVGPTTAAYNPAAVSNSGTTDNYTLNVNDQRLPGSIVNSGVSRTWKLGEDVAGGSIVALQLQWNVPEEESQYVHTSSQILRSDGTSIVQYTSVLPVSGSSPYATAGGAFSSLTQFSVASYSLLLPVRLTGFTARRAGVFNQVDWKVDGQEQPSQYVLERSADGIVFNEIAVIKPVSGKASYTYADTDPGDAVTYYRLKMPAGDDKNILYSRTVTITNQQGAVRAELRPSVTVGNETSLFIILPQNTTLGCTLTDAIGRVQQQTVLSLEKGAQTIPLHLGKLSKGIYYLRVAGNDGIIKILPLVKQ